MGFDLKFEQDGAFSGTSKAWLASRMGVDICRGITLDLSLFNPATHYPNGFIPSGMCLAKEASGLYGPYNGLLNEVQTINLGAASAGTFTITFQGSTTGNIAYNATPAVVQAALEALPNINPGDVTVTGGPLPGTDITLTFSGQYAGVNVTQITADGALTTGETFTIATTVAGGGNDTALDTMLGHLLEDVKVRTTNGAGRAVGALYWNGIIVESRLPANSGIDSTAKTAMAAHIRYE